MEPFEFAGVEFVPKDNGEQALEDAVANLVEGTDEVGGAVELGKVELEPAVVVFGSVGKEADGELF